MIQSHLYARLEETRVYSNPDDHGESACIVHQGDWLGVISRQGDWVHVLGIDCEGWVRANDVESRPPSQLHILMTEGKPIHYVNSPGPIK